MNFIYKLNKDTECHAFVGCKISFLSFRFRRFLADTGISNMNNKILVKIFPKFLLDFIQILFNFKRLKISSYIGISSSRKPELL